MLSGDSQPKEDQQNQQKGHAPQPESAWAYRLVVAAILGLTIAFVGTMVVLSRLGVFNPSNPSNAANFTAALGAYFAVVGTLVGAYFGIKASSDAQSRVEERVAEAEKRVESAPQQAKPAWDLARATLDQYFQRNLGQIRAVFVLSVSVMVVGFVVICYGVLRAFQSPDALLPATIASLAGVITEFIGATFLFIYRSAIQQAIDYSKSLERINAVGMAMQILDNMPDPAAPDDLKSKTKATLVEQLVQQAYEGSRGDPAKHKQ
jgi:hypothetical protein